MKAYFEKNPATRHLVVYSYDRVARNMTDWAELTEGLGVTVISATEPLSEGPAGELVQGVQVSVAKYQSRASSARISASMREKASRGLYPSYAPYGYRNAPATGQIVLVPEEAQLVRAAFEIYGRGGVSLAELARQMRARGMTGRRQGEIRKRTMERILKNPFYCGLVVWNGEEFDGRHEAIISVYDFRRVQEIMAGKAPRVRQRHSFPYKGVLKCYCGRSMTASIAKGKYVYYFCSACGEKHKPVYYPEARVAELLLTVIRAIRPSSDEAAELLRLIRQRNLESKAQRDSELNRLRRDLRKLDTLIEGAYEDKILGNVPEAEWQERDRRWRAKRDELRLQLGQLESPSETSLDDVSEVLELLDAAPELYLKGDHPLRASMVRAVAWNCILRGETVDVNYKTPFDLIAQGVESGNWYA